MLIHLLFAHNALCPLVKCSPTQCSVRATCANMKNGLVGLIFAKYHWMKLFTDWEREKILNSNDEGENYNKHGGGTVERKCMYIQVICSMRHRDLGKPHSYSNVREHFTCKYAHKPLITMEQSFKTIHNTQFFWKYFEERRCSLKILLHQMVNIFDRQRFRTDLVKATAGSYITQLRAVGRDRHNQLTHTAGTARERVGFKQAEASNHL